MSPFPEAHGYQKQPEDQKSRGLPNLEASDQEFDDHDRDRAPFTGEYSGLRGVRSLFSSESLSSTSSEKVETPLRLYSMCAGVLSSEKAAPSGSTRKCSESEGDRHSRTAKSLSSVSSSNHSAEEFFEGQAEETKAVSEKERNTKPGDVLKGEVAQANRPMLSLSTGSTFDQQSGSLDDEFSETMDDASALEAEVTRQVKWPSLVDSGQLL